jgi:hypothetical protein
MGFGKLTKQRREYLRKKEEESRPIEIKLKDLRRLFSWKHGVDILKFLSEGDKTSSEIRQHIGDQTNQFLTEAKRLGIVERYYDKKSKKYYFHLIVNKNKGLLDCDKGQIQLRILTFLLNQ